MGNGFEFMQAECAQAEISNQNFKARENVQALKVLGEFEDSQYHDEVESTRAKCAQPQLKKHEGRVIEAQSKESQISLRPLQMCEDLHPPPKFQFAQAEILKHDLKELERLNENEILFENETVCDDDFDPHLKKQALNNQIEKKQASNRQEDPKMDRFFNGDANAKNQNYIQPNDLSRAYSDTQTNMIDDDEDEDYILRIHELRAKQIKTLESFRFNKEANS